MNKMAKTVSVAGFVIIMIAASSYLYLLTSRDSQGFSPWGNNRLLLTIGVAVMACAAAGPLFYFFLRHDRDESSKILMAHLPPLTQSPTVDLTHKVTTPGAFDLIAWQNLNPWLVEGQADDRMPMLGATGDGNGSVTVRPSTARQTHQMMYKKWSQARHD
jgi:hypothetical protein